jgi:hypothetical protein
LEVGGTRLQADTDLPLRTGETLTVRVEKQADQTLLRVLARHAPPAEVQSQALRTALPRQTPLPPLLANLAAASTQRAGETTRVPPQIQQAAHELLRSLPDVRQVATPDGLRRAVEQSGVFFEARLAQAATQSKAFPANDLKGGLLKLIALLTGLSSRGDPAPPPPPARAGAPAQGAATPQAAAPAQSAPTQRAEAPLPDSAPPMRSDQPRPQAPARPTIEHAMPTGQAARELHGQAEGSVSRITLHQLSSMPTEESPRPILLLEMPVRTPQGSDVWGLRIEQEPPQRKDGRSLARWSVSMAFDIEGLGPVQARISLAGATVQANFWAERPATVAAIEGNLDTLRAGMAEAGLDVGNLHCFYGRPPEPRGHRNPSGIVNIKV